MTGSNRVQADFLAGGSSIDTLPSLPLPEIAILGRSNVGKSTFINRLTERKNLARTSSTPGRTQQVNLFKVKIAPSRSSPLSVILADLPGFGYAKLSLAERKNLSRLISDYILMRRETACIAMLNDCRREPGEEEIGIRDLVAEEGKHLIVVLTKCDKVSRSELSKRSQELARAFGLESHDIVLTGEKFPIEPFWERIRMFLASYEAPQDESI